MDHEKSNALESNFDDVKRIAGYYLALSRLPKNELIKGATFNVPNDDKLREARFWAEDIFTRIELLEDIMALHERRVSKVPITSPHPTNKHMVVGHIPPQCLLADAINQALLIGRDVGAIHLCWLDSDIGKAREAKEREKRTLGRANNNRHLEAEAFWKPLLEEFRELCEDGMKPDTARSEILGKWAEREDEPSMKTARKWLKLDGKAD